MPARRITSSLLLAGVLFGRGVAAEPAAAPVEYVAPAGCPPVEAFTEQLAARTPMFREHAAEHKVRIEVVGEPGGVLGRASLVLAGHAAERELRAARCEEVVEALALVVAILIDPNADTRPIAVAAPAPVESAPASAPPPAAPVVSRPPPPPRPVRPAPRPAPSPRPADASYRFIAGAALAAEGAVFPELTLGPRVFFGASSQRGWPWPSALRLAGARLFSPRIRGEEGSVKGVLDVARADVCLLRLAEGPLALEPCAGVDVGVLRIEGSHPRGGRESTDLYADVGALLRGSASFLDRFVAEVEVGADVPLVHYRYSFQGEAELFETATAGMHLGVGLGVRFP